MQKVGTLIKGHSSQPGLDGIVTVIFAQQCIIEHGIYLAFYAIQKGGLYFESRTLNISYFSINLDLNIS